MTSEDNAQSFVMPDYHDGSIVNLMASIIQCFGGKSLYKPLKSLVPDEIRQYENIVLLIIDGLGQEYLAEYGQQTFFTDHQRSTMTSVFPATTATAITTFMTGLAPQQHAITGWYMYLKELGATTAILPFVPRFGGSSFSKQGITPAKFLDTKLLFNEISADSYYVIHDDLVDSDYTRTIGGSVQPVGFQGLYDMLSGIQDIVKTHRRRKYIYAYWGAFDSMCHRHGASSDEAKQHFKDLARAIPRFVDSLKNSSVVFLITADHGFVNTGTDETIKASDHPDFVDTLTLPLCGEPRVAYCYVRPAKVKQFESYVGTHFKDICVMQRAQDLIDKNYFGLFEPHPRLFDRIGDYVLIMKNNYVMRDFVLGEKEFYFTGYHGGMSRAEMLVPLIVIGN